MDSNKLQSCCPRQQQSICWAITKQWRVSIFSLYSRDNDFSQRLLLSVHFLLSSGLRFVTCALLYFIYLPTSIVLFLVYILNTVLHCYFLPALCIVDDDTLSTCSWEKQPSKYNGNHDMRKWCTASKLARRHKRIG